MNSCGMEAKSCEMMSEAIVKNPDIQLTEIHAANNKFGKEGFELLFAGFDHMKSLEVLNFSNCIDERKDGLSELLDTVVTNSKTLRKLDISGNNYNKNAKAVEKL